MKISLATLSALGAVALGAACSNNDDSARDVAPVSEGGALPPGEDASAPTDASPADVDAEAAAPRVCSEDGFCHTAAPASEILRAVWGDGQGITWSVSESGAVYRHDGATWTLHTKLKGALSAIWGSGPNDIWIGGVEGIFHGQGATSATLVFTNVGAPGDDRAPITSIWGTGPKDVWAAGSFSTFPYRSRVLHYSDGFAGAGWQVDGASSLPALFSRVFGTAQSGVWLAGLGVQPVTSERELVVVRRAVGQTSFVAVPVPGDPAVPNGVGAIGRLFDAAAGGDGTLWVLGRSNSAKPCFVRGTSVDGVTYTWSFVAYGPQVGPVSNFVWGRAANDQWIGGEYGRLRRWDGTTWVQAKTTITMYPEIATLHGIWGDAQGDLWVVGEGIAMHRPAKKN
jgi:hypothetical protein